MPDIELNGALNITHLHDIELNGTLNLTHLHDIEPIILLTYLWPQGYHASCGRAGATGTGICSTPGARRTVPRHSQLHRVRAPPQSTPGIGTKTMGVRMFFVWCLETIKCVGIDILLEGSSLTYHTLSLRLALNGSTVLDRSAPTIKSLLTDMPSLLSPVPIPTPEMV